MKRSKQREAVDAPTRRRSRWWRGSRGKDQPDLEPSHDQPWVPTSGLTDRIRRSPRQ